MKITIGERKIEKNYKRNLHRFKDNLVYALALTWSLTGKICAILLVIFLPLVSMFAAANIIFRLPDLYQFDLDRTEVAREIQLEMGTGEISNLFSDYMFHKTDEFKPAKNVMFQGKESSVFTRPDRIAMERSRSLLDRAFILFLPFFPLTVFMIVLLLRIGQRRDLWIGYNLGLILYGLIALSALVLGSFPSDRHALYQWMVDVRFTKIDVLPQLFDNGYYVEAACFIIAISAILLFIGRSVIKKFAVLNKMF